MAATVADKLKIKDGYTLVTLNAPPAFKKNLGGLPTGVKLVTTADRCDQVHWFVKNRSQMEKELNKVLKLVNDDVVCWIYYPKGTSGVQTDLSRDKGWDALRKHDELQWINLISFDETWSTFSFRLRTESDKKKELKPNKREIFNWVNPETKEVRLPEDLLASLNKNPKQKKFFDTLSFTNKKEYIEWIVTARREETRMERVKGAIERLAKNWKNPRNI